MFDLDLEKKLSEAVRYFWQVRARQQDQQGKKTGRKDTGSRSAVTGGKHGDGFINLLAVIEVKSHVGSFGNNFNNRVEEALGSATDFWLAYREATFRPSARPWLGYLIMLEEHLKSTQDSKLKKLAHYPMRKEFQGISYAKRYEVFCERLVRERLYDAACFIMSGEENGLQGKYSESENPEISFRNFAASLGARAATFAKLNK